MINFVLKLGQKNWKSKDIPADWAMACIFLLSKSDVLSQISEFMPITIVSVVEKIFCSDLGLSDQLHFFIKVIAIFVKFNRDSCLGMRAALNTHLHCWKLCVMPKLAIDKLFLPG